MVRRKAVSSATRALRRGALWHEVGVVERTNGYGTSFWKIHRKLRGSGHFRFLESSLESRNHS
eukprot:6015968-Prymnesium_polylepis.1